ncbi:hypothetical protein [Nocardioides dilutus]
MNSTTRTSSKIRRYTASVVATAAVAVAGVACGTETVGDVEPAAPAQVKVQVPAHQPQSADAAERLAAKQYYEALKRHYMQSGDYSDSGAQSADSAERNGAKLRKERSSRHMGRPGPGF